MKLLKKILFFVLFSLTLSQVVENVVYALHENPYVCESTDNGQASKCSIFSEVENHPDEVSLDSFSVSSGIPSFEQKIYSKAFPFLAQYSIEFWQPPKIS